MRRAHAGFERHRIARRTFEREQAVAENLPLRTRFLAKQVDERGLAAAWPLACFSAAHVRVRFKVSKSLAASSRPTVTPLHAVTAMACDADMLATVAGTAWKSARAKRCTPSTASTGNTIGLPRSPR